MHLLGIRVDNTHLTDILKKTQVFLDDGAQHQIATVNPEFIVLAQKDKEFRRILETTDLNLADGFGVVLAGRLMGEKIKRVSGADLAEEILLGKIPPNPPLQKGGEKKSDLQKGGEVKVFLLGGRDGTAEIIAKKYPRVAGFSENQENAVELINQCRPNILLVALGAPKQEKWIAQNLKKIPSVKIAIGVGGAFKFLSGQVRRAPRWMRAAGLEWIWRTIMEPSRIIKVWRSVAVFGWLMIRVIVAATRD